MGTPDAVARRRCTRPDGTPDADKASHVRYDDVESVAQ